VRRAERAVARASEGARPPALSRARRPTAHPGRGLIHALALLAALGWAAQARAADPAPAPAKTIALKGDRLTVKVSAVPLDEVLQAIVAPSSGEIRGSVKQPHDVSIDFEEVPVQDGLGRLLGDQNFVLTFRENGTLRSLTLLGGPQEATSEARIVKPTQPGQPVATATEMMQRNVPVPAGSKLAQLIGPTATLQELLDISIRQEDASVRVEAMRASMGAIDTQADLKAMVVKSLRDTDDRTLENVIRGVAQDRAREIVSQIAAITQTPEIRARTTRLLQQMQPTPTAQ
jgi:hypothetical protein